VHNDNEHQMIVFTSILNMFYLLLAKETLTYCHAAHFQCFYSVLKISPTFVCKTLAF